jgi:hypothetical protein
MLTDLVTKANAGSTIQELADSLATNADFTSQFPIWQTSKEFTTKVVNNMFAGGTVSQADKDAAIDYIAGAITAGTFTKTSAVVALTSYMSSADGIANATYGSVSQAYQNKVEVAEYYTITSGLGDATAAERKAAISGVTDSATAVADNKATVDVAKTAAAVIVGSTKTLTTGVDALVGGDGNDTFNAVLQAAGVTGTTASPGDVVTGGLGSDTLNISVAGASGAFTIQALQTAGIENVLATSFNTTAGDTTIDTTLMTGVTNVGLAAASATGDTTFSGLKGIVDAQMKNSAANLTLTYNAATVAGTADTQNLNLSAVAAGTFSAGGIETINLTGALTANTLTAITAAQAKTLNISGDQNFTLTGATAIKTVDASANTGKTSLVLSNVATGQTVTLGSGNDTVDITSNLSYTDKISGGAGDDLLKISGSATFNSAAATSTTAEFLQVSGFETVDLASETTGATLDLKYIADVTTARVAANSKVVTFTGDTTNTAAEPIGFVLNGTTYATANVDFTSTIAATDAAAASAGLTTAINLITGFSAVDGTGTVTVTNASSGERVDLAITAGSANTFTESTADYSNVTVSNVTDQVVEVYTAGLVTATVADSTGTDDSLTVALGSAKADTAAAQTVTDLNVGVGLETLNLSSNGMKATVVGVSAGVAKTLGAISGDTALTTLNITGSSDLVISDHATDNTKLATIDASAFTGNLTLSDSVAALAQTITTGAGNDSITMGANLTSADVIDMGANTVTALGTMGKDTVTADVANRGSAAIDYKYSIANAETVSLKLTTGQSYLDGAGFSGVGAINLWNADGAPFNLSIKNYDLATTLQLGSTTNQESKGTYTLVPTDATGAADALSISVGDAGADDDVDVDLIVAGVETINVARVKADADNAKIDMTKAKATTINVTGGNLAGAAKVTNLDTLSTSTTTVNASGYIGLLAVTASTTGTAITSAIGNGANTIAGGAGADTVSILVDLAGDDAAGNGGIDTLNATITTSATEATTGFEVINYTIGNSKQVTTTASNGNGVDVATTFNLLGGNSQTTYATNYVSPAALKTIDMSGYTGKSTASTFAASQLVNTMTITGSAGTDAIVATTANNNAAVAAMSGVEALTINVAGGNSVFDFSKVSGGLAKVTIDDDNSARQFTATDLPDGVTIDVIHGATGDTLVVDQLNKAAADNSQSITIKTTATDTHTYNINASDVETLNIKMSDASTLGLAANAMTTPGAASTLNFSGNKIATVSSLNTDVKTVDGTGMTTGGGIIQTGRSTTGAVDYTGSVGNDTFIMMNSADNINGGADGSDTLDINVAAILGGIQVDLSQTGDQIVSLNGGANTGTITGFESVDLAGYTGTYGAVVTGSKTGGTIVGTANVDSLSAGAGSHTITAGGNADTIDLSASGADTVRYAFTTPALAATESGAATGDTDYALGAAGDTITGFVSGTDKIEFATAAFVNAGGTPASTLISTTTVTQNTRFLELTAALADGEMGTFVTAAAAATTANLATNDQIVIFANDGVDGYLYFAKEGGTGSLQAGELNLIAKIIGVTDIADGDVAVYYPYLGSFRYIPNPGMGRDFF